MREGEKAADVVAGYCLGVVGGCRSREKHYAFDYAFEEADGQEIVYRRTTKFLIQVSE